MSISGRVNTIFTKGKGKLYYRSILNRVQNPCPLKMTSQESQKILENSGVKNIGMVFQGNGAASNKKSVFDLSIVIPVYNGGEYLKDCVDSILNQSTDYSFEVICIDDGSTDSSVQILQSYDYDSRLKIVCQKNRGISGARNHGIEIAQGEYVMLVDNDDMLAENTFQCLLDYAMQHTADIVKCGHKIVSKRRQYDVIDSAFYVRHGRLQEDLIRYNGYIWGMLIKREIFQKVNFPEGFWYEDMITRLLIYRLCNTFVYVDRPLYYHRMHENNASSKVWSAQNMKALDQFVLAKEITEYADSIKLPLDEWVYRLYLSEFGRFLYERTIHLDIKVRQAVFKQCSDLLKSLTNKIEISDLQMYDSMLKSAFDSADFGLWEAVCKYYLL